MRDVPRPTQPSGSLLKDGKPPSAASPIGASAISMWFGEPNLEDVFISPAR